MTAGTLSRNGRAALAYASKGWPVFPLVGKKPLARLAPHGSRSATADRGTITRWWTLAPNANVGLAPGPVAGFWVLDKDPRNGGDQTLNDMVTNHGPMPDTLIQETGGGGLHYLFSWPSDGRKPSHSPGPGLDVKGDGGYIVAAPSVHPETRREYTWLEPVGTLCAAPEWLLDLVREKHDMATGGRPASEWAELVAGPIPEGRRNEVLARVVGLFFRRLPADVAADLAELWAEHRLVPPLDVSETRRTIASIATAELRRRGGAG